MDSRLLEYFLRVAELGSINRAAAALDLSQPALSRHMARLEKQLAVPVFVRGRGGVKLTDAGSLLADRARPLLRQFDQLQEQVGEHAGGQVAIGIPGAWQHLFTAPFVAAIRAASPAIGLRVYEGTSNSLRDQMSAGLLDLAIVPFDSTLARGYSQAPLVREPLILVRHRAAGLRSGSPVAVSQLAGLRMILPGRPNPLRRIVEHALARRGHAQNVVVETDTVTLCLELARREIGATIVPSSALSAIRSHDRLSWAPLRGLTMTWALCANRARGHSQAVGEATRFVFETIAQKLRERHWPGAERAPAGRRNQP